LALLLFILFVVNTFVSASWQDKLDHKLLSNLETADLSDTVSYLILLQDPKLNTDNVPPNDRPRFVYEALSSWSAKTQAPLIEELKKANVQYKSYWVANFISTKTNKSMIMDIAQREDVIKLEANDRYKVNLEVPEYIEEGPLNDTLKRQTETIEWNINWVGAPIVWNIYGYRGDGFVVANADTGVAWRHPALNQQYRGYNPNNPNSPTHSYNWWDAVHGSGGGNCGYDSQEPCDDNGHGTHTTGTAVGFNHNGYYIGVAPGAKWIGCRNMDRGYGTPETYSECLQFFIAPTDLNGQNPRPDLAPHAIGNSYGCPPSEGCALGTLEGVVNNVVNAGIFMSVSAGNSGPSCSSVADPPAVYSVVCSVGATGTQSSNIASFSSRGPSRYTNLGSPHIVAPGSGVRSAYPPSGYASLSGTSMASPHVTGAIPLLWEAKPSLVRQVAQTRALLEQTATPRPVNSCGTNGSPNNVYGHGELDVENAIQ